MAIRRRIWSSPDPPGSSGKPSEAKGPALPEAPQDLHVPGSPDGSHSASVPPLLPALKRGSSVGDHGGSWLLPLHAVAAAEGLPTPAGSPTGPLLGRLPALPEGDGSKALYYGVLPATMDALGSSSRARVEGGGQQQSFLRVSKRLRRGAGDTAAAAADPHTSPRRFPRVLGRTGKSQRAAATPGLPPGNAAAAGANSAHAAAVEGAAVALEEAAPQTTAKAVAAPDAQRASKTQPLVKATKGVRHPVQSEMEAAAASGAEPQQDSRFSRRAVASGGPCGERGPRGPPQNSGDLESPDSSPAATLHYNPSASTKTSWHTIFRAMLSDSKHPPSGPPEPVFEGNVASPCGRTSEEALAAACCHNSSDSCRLCEGIPVHDANGLRESRSRHSLTQPCTNSLLWEEATIRHPEQHPRHGGKEASTLLPEASPPFLPYGHPEHEAPQNGEPHEHQPKQTQQDWRPPERQQQPVHSPRISMLERQVCLVKRHRTCHEQRRDQAQQPQQVREKQQRTSRRISGEQEKPFAEALARDAPPFTDDLCLSLPQRQLGPSTLPGSPSQDRVSLVERQAFLLQRQKEERQAQQQRKREQHLLQQQKQFLQQIQHRHALQQYALRRRSNSYLVLAQTSAAAIKRARETSTPHEELGALLLPSSNSTISAKAVLATAASASNKDPAAFAHQDVTAEGIVGVRTATYPGAALADEDTYRTPVLSTSSTPEENCRLDPTRSDSSPALIATESQVIRHTLLPQQQNAQSPREEVSMTQQQHEQQNKLSVVELQGGQQHPFQGKSLQQSYHDGQARQWHQQQQGSSAGAAFAARKAAYTSESVEAVAEATPTMAAHTSLAAAAPTKVQQQGAKLDSATANGAAPSSASPVTSATDQSNGSRGPPIKRVLVECIEIPVLRKDLWTPGVILGGQRASPVLPASPCLAAFLTPLCSSTIFRPPATPHSAAAAVQTVDTSGASYSSEKPALELADSTGSSRKPWHPQCRISTAALLEGECATEDTPWEPSLPTSIFEEDEALLLTDASIQNQRQLLFPPAQRQQRQMELQKTSKKQLLTPEGQVQKTLREPQQGRQHHLLPSPRFRPSQRHLLQQKQQQIAEEQRPMQSSGTSQSLPLHGTANPQQLRQQPADQSLEQPHLQEEQWCSPLQQEEGTPCRTAAAAPLPVSAQTGSSVATPQKKPPRDRLKHHLQLKKAHRSSAASSPPSLWLPSRRVLGKLQQLQPPPPPLLLLPQLETKAQGQLHDASTSCCSCRTVEMGLQVGFASQRQASGGRSDCSSLAYHSPHSAVSTGVSTPTPPPQQHSSGRLRPLSQRGRCCQRNEGRRRQQRQQRHDASKVKQLWVAEQQQRQHASLLQQQVRQLHRQVRRLLRQHEGEQQLLLQQMQGGKEQEQRLEGLRVQQEQLLQQLLVQDANVRVALQTLQYLQAEAVESRVPRQQDIAMAPRKQRQMLQQLTSQLWKEQQLLQRSREAYEHELLKLRLEAHLPRQKHTLGHQHTQEGAGMQQRLRRLLQSIGLLGELCATAASASVEAAGRDVAPDARAETAPSRI
ncbi:hypothetical protein cyc_02907 [Cyclospora cayetanensis]|uniref:Uncharacterized protein n=1 Tax=Cyclospora cayetanensis TaxID=88456 RepID=A0A1D3CYH6_9EIME|nr:hypothetical protein cyc_02907 [Cyclospora cayetanensis]